MTCTPFTIAVPDAVLDDLRARLHNIRWPETRTGRRLVAGHSARLRARGVPVLGGRLRLASPRGLAQPVRPVHDRVDGLAEPGLHFVHVRSPHPDAMPLSITHGWPGSIVEFHKVIEPLTDPTAHGGSAADAFHVVAPSLPGFGFSGKPLGTGWGVQRIGEAFSQLMADTRLRPVRRAGRRLGLGGDHGNRWKRRRSLRGGARHARHGCQTETRRHTDGRRATCPRRAGVLPGVGLGVLEATVDAAAVDRIWARRLAGGASCVDPREVLGLDGLRWPSGERAHPRRAARQHHAVLDQRQRSVVGAASTGRASAEVPDPRPSPSRRDSPCTRRRSCRPYGLGSRIPSPTSGTGRNSRRAVTSLPSRCPTSTSTTFAPASASSAEAVGSAVT